MNFRNHRVFFYLFICIQLLPKTRVLFDKTVRIYDVETHNWTQQPTADQFKKANNLVYINCNIVLLKVLNTLIINERCGISQYLNTKLWNSGNWYDAPRKEPWNYSINSAGSWVVVLKFSNSWIEVIWRTPVTELTSSLFVQVTENKYCNY